MESEYVHIVSLDAPSPADYGGAIDIYHKIAALSATGKKVILHYFNYKQGRNVAGLTQHCYKIYSYKRRTGFKGLSLHLPYIVRSRINRDLIEKLNHDAYPIILEGIHCSGILPFLNNHHRKIVLRLHNNEEAYYKSLAQTTSSTFKRLYYLWESRLLKRYQRLLPKDLCIAGLSESDLKDFEAQHFTNLHFIPTFIPWQEVLSITGAGNYCLYQGNLSIAENEKAALWLVDHIFSKSSIPFIIAGKEPSGHLIKKLKGIKNIQIIADPTEEKMQMLVSNAQLNILPSFNNTGVKLKLLHALFNGRYCLVNPAGVEGSGIKSGIVIVSRNEEMAEQVSYFFTKCFSEKEVASRRSLLEVYNNKINARKLNALIS